jgi:hypothetical protein
MYDKKNLITKFRFNILNIDFLNIFNIFGKVNIFQ